MAKGAATVRVAIAAYAELDSECALTRELLTLRVKAGLTRGRGPLDGHDQKRGVASGRSGKAFSFHFDPAEIRTGRWL